jgi:hypothetical protein
MTSNHPYLGTSPLRRFLNLAKEYGLATVGLGNSPQTFWTLEEAPRVSTSAALHRYRDACLPPYLLDYSAKLSYDRFDDDGIPVLAYGGDVGEQINPEAAFQYALALHDHHLQTGAASVRERFLEIAEHFRSDQSAEGDWPYRFQWFEAEPPWFSALAQSRGISTMLRAWMATDDDRYLDAARAAHSKFDVPTSQGGYQGELEGEIPYYEEHPQDPRCVFNGFMASMLGLWELAEWTDDDRARRLWDRGLDSLERLLPRMTHEGWTLYNLDPESPVPNVHSPRYHRLVISYLAIIHTLEPRPIFERYLAEWRRHDSAPHRFRALGLKALHKVLYR